MMRRTMRGHVVVAAGAIRPCDGKLVGSFLPLAAGNQGDGGFGC